jgi:hypothetical protein
MSNGPEDYGFHLRHEGDEVRLSKRTTGRAVNFVWKVLITISVVVFGGVSMNGQVNLSQQNSLLLDRVTKLETDNVKLKTERGNDRLLLQDLSDDLAEVSKQVKSAAVRRTLDDASRRVKQRLRESSRIKLPARADEPFPDRTSLLPHLRGN